MKILLTGANGTLGTQLRETFKDNEVITVLQRDLDLTKTAKIVPHMMAQHPDLIINAAAYNDVDGAESNSDLAFTLNAYAVEALATAAKQLKIPIVHYSTDYVFDGVSKDGYDESSSPHPISAYGASKQKGEAFVINSGAEYILIRTSRLYGEWNDEGVSKPSFVKKMLEIAHTKDIIEAVDDEVSSPTYARDLAEATGTIVKQGSRGIFHRSNDGSCTWYEFAREIFAQTGWHGTLKPVPSSRFTRVAKRPQYSVLTSKRLAPMRSWQAALREHLNRINPTL